MPEQEFVDSVDGTRLRVVRLGKGPTVVLVHGTAGGKGDWLQVARSLADSHEVITFDRRGRGDSGDASEYSLAREVEDVLAVTGAFVGPVHLVGHSFGAILCLFAALRSTFSLKSLVVYEPPLGVQAADDNWLDDLDATLASGDLDSAIRKFAAGANITDDELQTIAASVRSWAALRDGVRVAGREIRAAKAELPFRDGDLGSIEVPALVLLGADQNHPSYAGVEDLATRLGSATLVRVPGRHLAIAFAPDAVVETLRDFFAAVD